MNIISCVAALVSYIHETGVSKEEDFKIFEKIMVEGFQILIKTALKNKNKSHSQET